MDHLIHYDQRTSHTTTNSTTTQTDHSSFMGPIGAAVMDINSAHGQRFIINDNTNELVPSIPAISLPTATIPQIPNNMEMNLDSHSHNDIEMNPDSLPTTTLNNNDSNIDAKLFDRNTRYVYLCVYMYSH